MASSGANTIPFEEFPSVTATIKRLTAERDEARAAVQRAFDLGEAAASPALLDRARTAEQVVERVRELHVEGLHGCDNDNYTWPCPTIRALDGAP